MTNILSSDAYKNPELAKQIYKPTVTKSMLNINTMVIKSRTWKEWLKSLFCPLHNSINN
jgi:hypothetical protein